MGRKKGSTAPQEVKGAKQEKQEKANGGTAPTQKKPPPSIAVGSPTDPSATACSLADGKRFRMPATTSFAEELLTPSAYLKVPTQVYVACFSLTLLTILLKGALPNWVFIVSFLFWRSCYDVGLGLLLRFQSSSFWFSEKFKKLLPKYPKLRKWLEEGTMLKLDGKPVTYKISEYPNEFNAWILFRIIVNIILANDFVSYLVFVYVYIEVPETLGVTDYILYLLGLCLMTFALWSKSDAHRVLGNFAWYWGDFFFTLEGDLNFDGIFQMFPHPMYTVGYCFYYGLSLVSHSYTVFYVSVLAHIMQMLFLALCENPHIEKIYGSIKTPTEEERLKDQAVFRDQWGYFQKKKDMVLLFNLSLFRAADVFTVLILVYSTVIAFIIDRWEWHLVHFALWRLFHTVGLGCILRRQSSNNMWVERFSSPQAAFDNWKKVYNLSLTMNHALFIVFALHCFRYMPENSLIRPGDEYFYWFKISCGVLLVLLNIYVSDAVYKVLGDFGWFYGDFFIPNVPCTLHYSGIYRYLNNPESTLGYSGYYGIALITSSYRVGVVAACCHVSAILFSYFVEGPHMRRKYGESIRESGGLTMEMKRKTKELKENIKNEVLHVKETLEEKVEHVKENLEERTAPVVKKVVRRLTSPRSRKVHASDEES